MRTPLDPEKYYYSISEVAEHFDITATTIRHWESEFDFLSPRKNKKGDRLFSAQDIEDIRLIYYLVKEQGFTLKGAASHIKSNKKSLTKRLEALKTLRIVRAELEKMKNALTVE